MKGSDRVMLMAYLPNENRTISLIGGAERLEGVEHLVIPECGEGIHMETYVSFISADYKTISNSVYTGQVFSDCKDDKLSNELSKIMKDDQILEIGIDDKRRLYIKPAHLRFALIYRMAKEVYWDDKGLFLYSPEPREWTYFDWYKHIIKVAKDECGCKLVLSEQTLWINIANDLRKEIKIGNNVRVRIDLALNGIIICENIMAFQF